MSTKIYPLCISYYKEKSSLLQNCTPRLTAHGARYKRGLANLKQIATRKDTKMIWKEGSPDHEVVLEFCIKRPTSTHTQLWSQLLTLYLKSLPQFQHSSHITWTQLFTKPHRLSSHHTFFLSYSLLSLLHQLDHINILIYKIDHQNLNQVNLNQNSPSIPKTHTLIHSRRKRGPKHIFKRSIHQSAITGT